MTEAEILVEVRKIAAQLGPAPSIASPDDVVADLGLDSVELISLAIGIEERFQIVLPPHASATVRTVGDLCRLIAQSHHYRSDASC